MSRGFGKTQNDLLAMIRQRGKPMTFEDIRRAIWQGAGRRGIPKLRITVERSLRRALHRLTDRWHLIAIGDGGLGDPLRYFIHPSMIGMMGETPEAVLCRLLSKLIAERKWQRPHKIAKPTA